MNHLKDLPERLDKFYGLNINRLRKVCTLIKDNFRFNFLNLIAKVHPLMTNFRLIYSNAQWNCSLNSYKREIKTNMPFI